MHDRIEDHVEEVAHLVIEQSEQERQDKCREQSVKEKGWQDSHDECFL